MAGPDGSRWSTRPPGHRAGRRSGAGARRVAIVGAGVAGLCAAVGLGRAGIAATVYERAPAPPAGGGSLWLWANALRALDRIGLAAAVIRAGTPVSRYAVRAWNGELLWRFPVDALARRHPVPILFIARAELIATLLAALDPRRLRCGFPCAGFVTGRRGVRPLLDARAAGRPFFDPRAPDGPRSTRSPAAGEDETRYHALLGADGLRSAIRRQLLGHERPRRAGLVAWTGIAATDATRWPVPPGEMVSFFGAGMRFTAGTARVTPADPADDRAVHWFATEPPPATGARPTPAALARRFRRHQPGVAELVERTPAPIAFPVRDRPPAPRWGHGPVALLGDAAHPSTPDVAQGACQAIESGVAAAGWLGRDDDVERVLLAYQRSRQARTARIARVSRLMTALTGLRVPGYGGLTRLAMKTVVPTLMLNEYLTILDGV